MSSFRKIACIGGGVIGAGWVARFLYNGLDVIVCDPDPQARRKVEAVCSNADRAMNRLIPEFAPRPGTLTVTTHIDEAVRDAGLVVEAVPERLDIKRSVYAQIETSAPADALIASSTSGILPSELQLDMQHPQRLLVAHPFNPVYLLPLVELVGGSQTAAETMDRAKVFYKSIGMRPLHVRKEIEAFVADRLLEAVWREALWLVKDGIATTEEIDDAIRFGFGLRWAQMGTFETYRIAGGEAGMEHFLEQFGPCLKWPWTKLMDVPDLDDELVGLIAGQSDQQSGHHSIRELERIRDDNLVAIMRALKTNEWGAGQTLARYEQMLLERSTEQVADSSSEDLVLSLEQKAPEDWFDQNGHVSETGCLRSFAMATEAFFRGVGIDRDYAENTGSFSPVETRIRLFGNVAAQGLICVKTQLMSIDGSRLKLIHRLERTDGDLVAMGDHEFIHVDASNGKPGRPASDVGDRLNQIARQHSQLSLPDAVEQARG